MSTPIEQLLTVSNACWLTSYDEDASRKYGNLLESRRNEDEIIILEDVNSYRPNRIYDSVFCTT